MGTNTYPLEPLENLAEIHDSKRVPVKKSDRKPGPYPYYGASGIVDYVDSYIFDGEFLLLAEDGENLRSQNLPIAFLAKGKFWVNNHAHVLKGKKGNNTQFLCYALQVADIHSYLSGSTRPKLTQADMKRILVPAPEPREQDAIAHILGTLDDKIELNRQMNRTLEAMAQALFKSWFIDFDPVVVNALRAGNPVPEKFAQRAAHYRSLLDRSTNSPLTEGEGQGVREKKQKLPQDLLDFARSLRKHQTDAEKLLWQLLRGRRFLGFKFRRQHPVKPYVLDFYCHELKLAVEVDGGQHNTDEQRLHDSRRTAFLEQKGITVVRYWADNVLKNTQAVLEALYVKVCALAPSPQPLSQGERGFAAGLESLASFCGKEAALSLPSPLGRGAGGEGNLPPEEILRLFPDRFQDSELGPIPEGWETQKLGNVIDIHDSKRIPLNSRQRAERKGPYRYYGASGIMDYVDDYIFDGTYILVGEDGTVIDKGDRPVVQYVWGKFWVNNHAHVLSGKNRVSNDYLYLILKNTNVRPFITGAVQPKISQTNLKRIPIILPTEEVRNSFSDFIRTLFVKYQENSEESCLLEKLRDTLLPKLISGELRVPDAEKLLEDAL